MTAPTKPRVLAVDDRKENLLVLESILEELDVEVMTAQSGNDALALMLDHEFVVVLMDVQMPDMDGFETVELMKRNKRTSHVPVIYITAASKESHFVFRGYETGAVDYVFKPVEPEILRGKLRVFIELYQLRRELIERNDELERLSRELERAAMTDPLTGLYNRRFLKMSIDKETSLVRRALRNRRDDKTPHSRNTALAFLLFDIDHFKSVNDDHGHDIGDLVLVEFADVLRQHVRGSDILVRWGGEEFLAVLRQTDREELATVAERLRKGIEEHRFHYPGDRTLAITSSVGCCAYPLGDPSDFDWEQVVGLADWALMSAKRAGRNRAICVECSEGEMDDEQRKMVLRDPEAARAAGILRLCLASEP